jgi:uncharacterized NAD(P)/FAD-binding protein YdhS
MVRVHAHGASACAFRVLRGSATELRLDGGSAVHGAGSVACAGAGVHQVSNDGVEPLVTLHVYAPPLPVEQPSLEEGRRVVVVGGGFSGAAVAIHLLRAGDPTLRVTLVDPRPLCRGPAWDTDPSLLLNVPVGRMSVDPSDPDDARRHFDARPGDLLPRARYADYLSNRLQRALSSPVRLRWARTAADAVERSPHGWRVALQDGRSLPADTVVLATGLGPPSVPSSWSSFADHRRLMRFPLAPGAIDEVGRDDRVLVLGTGLTAVDAVLLLARRWHRGPVHAVSRRALWPRPHLPEVSWTGPQSRLDPPETHPTADGLASWLAAHVAAETERGLPWQVAFDAVRPLVPALWSRLDARERTRFLERWRPLWEVLRHRAPAPLMEVLAGLASTGALRTHAGGARPIGADDVGFDVELEGGVLRFERVLVCTGAVSDPRRWGSPLWDGMLRAGLVHPDPHGLGVLTDERGATLDPDGAPTGLYALGGVQRARSFESTAVPELAAQAARVAAAASSP